MLSFYSISSIYQELYGTLVIHRSKPTVTMYLLLIQIQGGDPTVTMYLLLIQTQGGDPTVTMYLLLIQIQGGDPTASGKGGQSIWGKPFRDEFKPSLKHAGTSNYMYYHIILLTGVVCINVC